MNAKGAAINCVQHVINLPTPVTIVTEQGKWSIRKMSKLLKAKHLCVECQTRPALFRVKGGYVHADKHHNLCFQCDRALREANRVIYWRKDI